jgi:hypothetical protein
MARYIARVITVDYVTVEAGGDKEARRLAAESCIRINSVIWRSGLIQRKNGKPVVTSVRRRKGVK